MTEFSGLPLCRFLPFFERREALRGTPFLKNDRKCLKMDLRDPDP